MRTFLATAAIGVLLFSEPNSAIGQRDFGTERDCCDYWEFQLTHDQSKYKLFMEYQEGSIYIRQDDKSILCGIQCLLNREGDKRRAAMGANLSLLTSTANMPNPTVEVASLYMISKMFGVADNVHVIELSDDRGNSNSRKSIRKAYGYYRKWFAEVKKLGLSKAREGCVKNFV